MKKSRLYLVLTIACLVGYSWVLATRILEFSDQFHSFTVCPIKLVAGIPCPSCGSTRAVQQLLDGEFFRAILLNPIGLLLFLGLVTIPFWLLFDISFKKATLFRFYNQTEKRLKQKKYAIPAIILVLCNWGWNITKGL